MSYLNPEEPVDNWEGATFNPEGTLPRAGRNRLYVRIQPHPFPYPTQLFIKRCEDRAYVFATVEPRFSRAPTEVVITGLGKGPYHVAAILGGGAGVPERHFTWGAEVIRFRSQSGGRFHWSLLFGEPTP